MQRAGTGIPYPYMYLFLMSFSEAIFRLEKYRAILHSMIVNRFVTPSATQTPMATFIHEAEESVAIGVHVQLSHNSESLHNMHEQLIMHESDLRLVHLVEHSIMMIIHSK